MTALIKIINLKKVNPREIGALINRSGSDPISARIAAESTSNQQVLSFMYVLSIRIKIISKITYSHYTRKRRNLQAQEIK